MADVAPELYEAIEKEFKKNISKHSNIKKFNKKLEKGKATAEEVSIYASNVGDCAAAAFEEVMTEDALPNGRIYWNIADRVIKPVLKQIFDMVMDAAKTQQEAENAVDGFKIKPSVPNFPEQKTDDLMFKFVEIFDKAEDE